ncbi:MAG: MSHA biogenesis protein MshE [Methylococcaceae bacterium]|nr:MAG: MSHA biogenesis protein MshE [Methylococcaceae bacterium]
MRKRIRLGDLLVEANIITQEQLEFALTEQKKRGRKLGQMLVDLQYLTEDKLLQFLSEQLKLPLIDLRHHPLKEETVRMLPETMARRFRAIVLGITKDGVLVGMSDPTDIFAYDELSRILNSHVIQAVVREKELLRNIDLFYGHADQISDLADEIEQEISSQADFHLDTLISTEMAVDAPVARLLQAIFEDAVKKRASDIHIEPDQNVLRIRLRIDGVLDEQLLNEVQISPSLISRLKLMGGMDISEKRRPQDGRFRMKVKEKSIDVRVASIPLMRGENVVESVVMRLLDQSGQVLHLAQLGMPENIRERFRRQIHRPNGIVLITGPTGSGKTTTLYAALSELNDPGKKIITIEDPVEYQMPRLNQVQVNAKINLTFASILRTTLRLDPDIIMLGEIRDQETAEIAIRAALTGHMVLSSVHTNDAIGTAVRLMDMGIEGYLVASSLRAIIAQRLVRRICPDCKAVDPLERQQIAWVEALAGQGYRAPRFYRGDGCNQCNNTGYLGRVGVYELLELSVAMMRALQKNDSILFTRTAQADPAFRSLARCALDYAEQGLTTVEEVQRIANESIAEDAEESPEIGDVLTEKAVA